MPAKRCLPYVLRVFEMQTLLGHLLGKQTALLRPSSSSEHLISCFLPQPSARKVDHANEHLVPELWLSRGAAELQHLVGSAQQHHCHWVQLCSVPLHTSLHRGLLCSSSGWRHNTEASLTKHACKQHETPF